MPAANRPDLLSVVTEEFGFERGYPLPLGATVERGGINFAIFSRHATAVTLVLFLPGSAAEIAAFPLDPKRNRTGDVWHAFVAGLNPGIEYAYRMDGPISVRHRFDAEVLLADPYALALNGRRVWGDSTHQSPDVFRRALIVSRDYDWALDQPINRPLADSVIYELHVRGFTQDGPSPGFLGLLACLTTGQTWVHLQVPVGQVVAQVFEFVEDAALVLDSFWENRSDSGVKTRATIADYQLE